MDATYATKVNVAKPGSGESASIPGFGAVYKIYSRDNGGELAMLEHPFAVGFITAPHRHTREDETSIVLEGQIGFRSDDDEVVLGPGGYITKPRGQMHAMWNAGTVPGRIVEVITPGGFELYFGELADLLAASQAAVPAQAGADEHLHESDAFARLAEKYHISYGNPPWLDDVMTRYGLNPPTH
ncbi:MAG TPA: cupin domain-containing protein [Trebonia sp.]|nr:cupin domain-containing protein [Trebonia sp.]